MEALKLVQPENPDHSHDWSDREATYEVDPDVMYPAALDYVRALQDGSESPNQPQAIALAKLMEIKDLDQAFADATEGPEGLSAKRREAREAVLECARLVFTEKLHQESGGEPMALHIGKSDKWRLYPKTGG